jgi:hypothetical protein
MAAVSLCESSLANLKNALRDEFPDAKSSHIQEALAYSLGHNTSAALKASMATFMGSELNSPFALLDTTRMRERLVQLGYQDDQEFDFEVMQLSKIDGTVSTMPESAYDIEYKTVRQLAWRNLMVCAVNAALDQKLFGLRPGDNRFKGMQHPEQTFDFVLPNGLAVRGSIADIGHDEISIHAAVNPKGDAVRAFNAGFDAGDAFGTTWVERRNGAWIQSNDRNFTCRRDLAPTLAALEVKPAGFGDRGAVIM